MASRIVDPQRFRLDAAIVDWQRISRKHLKAGSITELVKQRKIAMRVVQLRWLVHPSLGYPTEPFKVWRRAAMPMEKEKDIPFDTFVSFPGLVIYAWAAPVVYLKARLQVTTAATVIAYAGAPFGSAMIDWQTLSAGTKDITLSGVGMICLVVSGDATLQKLTGLTGKDAVDDGSWQLVERVGLPVDTQDWAGVLNLAAQQGLEGALTDPIPAAQDRFRRGAALFGWDDEIEPGRAAPPWTLANPNAILQAFKSDLSDPLKKMVTTLPPRDHQLYTLNQTMAINASGKTADTHFTPISTLTLGVASDPLLSLITGFGTAFDDVDIPKIDLANTSLFGDPTRSDWDFMVTAHYEKGRDGNSGMVEYAAIVHQPKLATPPPKPYGLAASTEGLTPPSTRDQPYKGVVRLAWDKLPDMTPFRVASYAAARAGIVPPAPVTLLLGPRKFDPLAAQPISATTSVQNEQTTGTIRGQDDSYAIAPASNPNMVRYAVAHQDLYGLWSGWTTAGHQLHEPLVQSARILSARLDVTAAPVPAACPATLVIDFTWDWAVRSPEKITLVGRLYAAASPGAPPASVAVPAGLQKSFPGGAGAPLVVSFTGNDSGTVAGATLTYITDNGLDVHASPVVVAGPRRYRLTVPGFSLNYASTGHVGIALWAQGREHSPPQRDGPWSNEPTVTSASDPRPPVITMSHEDVELASLADGRGEHRVRLDWAPITGSTGYYVYETTESKFRTDQAMGEPLPGLTLAARLLALRNAFNVNPVRRPFTRVNKTPITGLDAELVIPRGSKEIHMYLVLGVSAGQVESAWPDLSDPDRKKRFRAFAAPQIAAPSPLVLEVTRDVISAVDPPLYRARLAIKTRPGAKATRIDLYRTRVEEAALMLDTMGPPVASISGSTAQWTVTPVTSTGPGENQPIGIVTGFDQPSGSWKRVFYRAVAWSGDDEPRAIYGGRSAPSAAMEVIVPPAQPPDLAAITWSWPGGPLTDVLFTTTCSAPVDMTPLGPHRIKVDAMTVKPDGSVAVLYVYPPVPATGRPDDTLATVPTMAGPGLSREAVAGGVTRYRVRVAKPTLADGVRLRILLTDPLGRTTERVLQSAAGSPLPTPDISAVTLTTVPGNKFILGFTTGVQIPATPIGPYHLLVNHTPLGPFPPFPPGTPIGIDATLPSIKPAAPAPDPFTDVAAIPLRRGVTVHGQTPISIYLRAKGKVAVTLTGPDGKTVTVSRVVP